MPVIGIGLPAYNAYDPRMFAAVNSLAFGWADLAPHDWYAKPVVHQMSPVHENRLRIAKMLLEDGEEGRLTPDGVRSSLTSRPADVLLWCDSDCYVEPAEFVRLVQRLLDAPADVGAIGYPCPIRGDDDNTPNVCPFVPDGMMATRASAGISLNSGLVDVDWIGFGIIATRAQVYRDMDLERMPYFRWQSGEGFRAGGEDVLWCRDARSLGYRVQVDTDVCGTHAYVRHNRLRGRPRIEETKR